MHPPLKIAQVEPYPANKGGERHATDLLVRDTVLAQSFRDLGCHIRAFKTTRSSSASVVRTNEEVKWEYYPCDDPDVADRYVDSSSLNEAVLGWSPDFIFVRGAGTTLERSLLDNYAGPYGVIIGGRYRTSSLVYADVVLTESAVQDRYLGYRIGRKRTIRLPKYVDPMFRPGQAEDDGERPIDVVAIGKLEPHKNYKALIPLFSEDLHIVIAGEGSVRPHLESAARDSRAIVDFRGEVASRDVAHILHRARLLAHPAPSEGFPRAVAEAMTAGIPSVCRQGVVTEPLVHGVNGLTAESDEEFVQFVLKLLSDETLHRRLALGAFQTATAEFSRQSIGSCAAEVVQRIQAIIQKGPRNYRRSHRAARIRQLIWDFTTAAAARWPRLAETTRSLNHE